MRELRGGDVAVLLEVGRPGTAVEKWDQVGRGPCGGGGQVRELTSEQVAALFDLCARETAIGRRDRVLLGLFVGAGLRRAEALRLDWGDVQRRAIGGSLRTVLGIRGCGVGAWRRERELIISPELGAALTDWAEASGGDGAVLRKFWTGGHLGPRLAPAGLRGIVADLGQRVGLADLTARELRLTYARRQARVVGLAYVSLLLGDGSVQTTLASLGDVGPLPVTVLWAEGAPR